jgi:hypothetical protein
MILKLMESPLKAVTLEESDTAAAKSSVAGGGPGCAILCAGAFPAM